VWCNAMIRKILKLQNIGLLQDACATGAVDLPKVTAIYADNGRGKTMFASVMRACQLGDAGRLNARRTIDSENPPELDLLLPTGIHVEFKGNAWTGILTDIVVFDSEFVEQNVYSGLEVRPEQRQSLLDFALGDQTVLLKQRVERLSQDIKGQTGKRGEAERTLSGYAPPYTVADFISLQPIADAEQQIDALQKRIEAAKNAQKLNARQSPTELKPLPFDIQAVFAVLSRQLLDVEETAEAVVKAHLAKHGKAGMEDWVSRGQEYLIIEQCPFCGQGIAGLDLIRAYRSHFNEAYGNLKREVAALEERVTLALATAKIDAAISSAETNAARIEAWKDQLELGVPTLDGSSLRSTLHETRSSLLAIVSAKKQQPLMPVGTQADVEMAKVAIGAINQAIETYNAELAAIVTKISEFKKNLAAEDAKTLQLEIRKLEASLKLQQPAVIATIVEYLTAETERKRLEEEKAQARERIDALMVSTLQDYQTSINQFLSGFGAEFFIEQLKPSYIGSSGEPRTEYALSLRNKCIKLGSREDMTRGQCFATALSDGDKRTLAFAFFLARLKADPNLAAKLVVLDDPVSSLDRNRRHQSIRLIFHLATECKQLIVLSHDPYFLRDFRDRLAELKPTPIAPGILTIKRVQNGYSAIGQCDIDDICSSDYYRHHRMVADYVDGKFTANTRDVAKAIRPLLEGYYHRRFPGKIPRRLMLGQIIALAVNPVTTGPLINLRPLAKELGEINDYASQFHHDPNLSDTAPVVDAELLAFARRALALIYKNG
jgi:wobble nucleotide-excising tRNase